MSVKESQRLEDKVKYEGSIHKTINYGLLSIVKYIKRSHVQVKFLETGYNTVTSVQAILRGVVKDKIAYKALQKKKKLEGKIYNSNKCGKFKIINYNGEDCVDIEFLNTGYTTKVSMTKIKSGSIKDKIKPVLYGIGYIGYGPYKTANKRRYNCWKSMFARCYSEDYLSNKPSYRGCTVSEEWHNFQNFAKWYEDNYIEGYQIDKDIKIEGNKIYSPDACMFVSRSDNVEKAKSKHYHIVSPSGEDIQVFNLKRFCEERDLPTSCMYGVANGRINSYKGWTKYVPDEDDVVVGGENSIVTCKTGEV